MLVGGDPSHTPGTVVTPTTVASAPLTPVTLKMVGSLFSGRVYLSRFPTVTIPTNPLVLSEGLVMVDTPVASLPVIEAIPIEIPSCCTRSALNVLPAPTASTNTDLISEIV